MHDMQGGGGCCISAPNTQDGADSALLLAALADASLLTGASTPTDRDREVLPASVVERQADQCQCGGHHRGCPTAKAPAAAINSPSVGEDAAPNESSPKTTNPIKNKLRCPIRLPSVLAPSGRPALPTGYALMVRNDCAPEAASSLVCVASAVYRIELSRGINSRPALTVARSDCRRFDVMLSTNSHSLCNSC